MKLFMKTSATDKKGYSEFSKPVATIKNGSTTFELHAYKAGTSCRIAKGATLEFGKSIGSVSAGLVYVTKDQHGLRAEDNHVDAEHIWKWIQDWMQKGMDAEREHAALVAVAEAAVNFKAACIACDDDGMEMTATKLDEALAALAAVRAGNEVVK